VATVASMGRAGQKRHRRTKSDRALDAGSSATRGSTRVVAWTLAVVLLVPLAVTILVVVF
jgi:hypothetical protein